MTGKDHDMTGAAPKNEVEILARAMCVALGLDPDEQVVEPPSRPDRGRGAASVVDDTLIYCPLWECYAWDAAVWLFKNSGGTLPSARFATQGRK